MISCPELSHIITKVIGDPNINGTNAVCICRKILFYIITDASGSIVFAWGIFKTRASRKVFTYAKMIDVKKRNKNVSKVFGINW